MIAGRTMLVLLAVGLMGLTASAEETRTFRQDLSGYSGAADTTLSKQFSEYNYGASTTFIVQDVGPDPYKCAIIRFADLFGPGAGQVPYGQTITSVTLSLYLQSDLITNPSMQKGLIAYPMLVEVTDFGNKDGAAATTGEVTRHQRATSQLDWGPPINQGPQADIDYDTTRTAAVSYTIAAVGSFLDLDVTGIVNAWYAGTLGKYGLLIHGNTDQTASFLRSSEYVPGGYRPSLAITYGPKCGDTAHRHPPGDFDEDCYVGISDLAMLVQTWLMCTDWEPPCNYVP